MSEAYDLRELLAEQARPAVITMHANQASIRPATEADRELARKVMENEYFRNWHNITEGMRRRNRGLTESTERRYIRDSIKGVTLAR